MPSLSNKRVGNLETRFSVIDVEKHVPYQNLSTPIDVDEVSDNNSTCDTSIK